MRMLLLVPLIAVAMRAQTFEVASVKPSPDGGRRPMRMTTDAARLDWTNIPFRTMVGRAFGVKQAQIVGPAWIGSEFFDISAKFPAGATYDQVGAMFEPFLKERFKLVAHREKMVMPVYELLAGKDVSKLHKSAGKPGEARYVGGAGRGLKGPATIAELAEGLSSWLDRPLIDKTGIEGVYDIDLRWSGFEYERAVMSGAASMEPFDGIAVSFSVDHPTIFSELREKMGLRVQSGKAPVEVLVIDRAEKVPTEN